MTGPRLTEERLRHYLDSNQVMRERMCLALLPLLGPFTEGKSRRPKGGPDGSRDIECLYQGTTPTWGAVGFRNGGGNDSDSRTAAKKKFRDDLDEALAENATLSAFLFFTNVDLTPGEKDGLIAYATQKDVKIVHVFDMEVLRNILDSRDGLLYREQYLDIPVSGDSGTMKSSDNSKPAQSTKVASCYIPLRFPKKSGTDELDEAMLVSFLKQLIDEFARCFGHTCVTVGIDDFVFLLTFEKAACQDLPGYVLYELEVTCHITEFVRALEERLNYFMKAVSSSPPRLKSLPSDQILDRRPRLGRNMPHRIYRTPPSGIVLEGVDGIALPANKSFTTSALLCLIGRALGGVKILLWDDVERYPDALKVITMIDQIGDREFSWDVIRLNTSNPESWEYCG